MWVKQLMTSKVLAKFFYPKSQLRYLYIHFNVLVYVYLCMCVHVLFRNLFVCISKIFNSKIKK